jgi:hypothetical protein
MAAPTLTEILDNVGTSTLEARLPGTIDQIFDSNPLAARLLQRDNVKDDGGKDIRQRIIYAKKRGGSYSNMDTFDMAPIESRTEMVFNWKQVYIDITIPGLSLLKNSGGKQIHDLVSDEMDEADMAAADIMGTMFFGDGAGNGGKDLTGLRAAIDDGTSYGTYGGITRASTDVIGSPGYAVQGNINTGGAVFSLSNMNTYFTQAVIGNERPDLILTTQALWNKWWERAQPAQRFAANESGNRMAGLGFGAINFNGADVVVDSHCQSGYVYFINTKFVKLVVHSKRLFAPTGWKYPINQDAAVQQLLFAGELVVSSPRMQVLATSIT